MWSNDPDEHATPIPITLNVTDAVGVPEQAPSAFLLGPARPSPFDVSTQLSFTIEHAAKTRLDIFDAAGRAVATLVDAEFPVGRHDFTWDGTDSRGHAVAAGMYFVRLTSGARTDQGRLIRLR